MFGDQNLSLKPTYMIQKCYSLFKTFFRNNQNNYDLGSFQKFEIYLLNHPESLNHHIHHHKCCHYPKFTYYRTYERNFIYRHNQKNVYDTVDISVVYCENEEAYHAILPYVFIIPYLQYSLAFVMSVLNDRLSNHLTVEEIEKKYDISKNTLYRWLKSYKNYYRIFLTMRNKKDMDFFVSYYTEPPEFVEAIYSITQTTIFQTNCTLFHHRN